MSGGTTPPPWPPGATSSPFQQQYVVPQVGAFAFAGGAATYFGTGLLGGLITTVTFGICYPFALVLLERWKAKHTTLNGRSLRFTGSAIDLVVKWIIWALLIIVTLGIYSFWVVPRLTKWQVENRVFADDNVPGRFRFTGGAGSYWLTAIGAVLLTVFTLGLGLPWALVLLDRWKANYTTIDGRQLRFTGSGSSLFGNWIKWLVLMVITLGIYSFWVVPRLTKWRVEHQAFV